ncbi:MAG TPA: hypothetical protein VML75_06550 [Kofleriaceae bacterium]|nr:hypothetical protein [Kofleriaceae bacterium]
MTDKSASPTSIDDLFARALARTRATTARLLGGGAMIGSLGAVAIGGAACDLDLPTVGDTAQADWVQYEGQRRTDMVSYAGQFWSECANPNTRFGCGSVDVFVKVRVKPVAGADLAAKEVGVVYSSPLDPEERTARGYYYATWNNGDEEWHVRVSLPTWRDFFTFNVFYRDGAYHTFYDDNQGEYHAINAGPSEQIIRVNTYNSTVAVTATGVQGTVSVRVADLDYDKQLRMVATVDGWETVLDFGMGAPGDKNKWYWLQDVYGAELWEIDLDLPGDYQRLEYAVQYRHGVINDATTYGFWANNGGNDYVVERSPDTPVVE